MRSNLSGFNIAVLLLYIITSVLVVIFHEPWRDELQIWLEVIKSHNPLDLYCNKDPNHPYLWYFLLFLVSFFSQNIVVCQIFNVLISVAIVVLILIYIDIDNRVKLLLAFNYFLFFEYMGIARGYGLSVLFLLLSILLMERNKKNGACVLLILLANTNLLGTILAAGIIFYFLIAKRLSFRLFFIAGLGVVVGLTDLYSQTFLAGGVPTQLAQQTIYNLEWFSSGVGTIYKGFIPLPNFFTYHFWNTNIMDAITMDNLSAQFAYFTKLKGWRYKQWIDFFSNTRQILPILATVFILGGIAFSFRKDWKVLMLFFLGTIVLWVLFAFIWHGHLRHHGYFFILYLACYYILYKNGGQTRFSKNMLIVILILQVPGSLFAYYMDIRYQFTGSKKAYAYIENNVDQTATITGGYDYAITPIAYYLDTPFYNPQSKKYDFFIHWSRKDSIYKPEIFHEAIALYKTSGKEVVVALSKSHQLEVKRGNLHHFVIQEDKADFTSLVSEAFHTSTSMVWDEQYQLFFISDERNNASISSLFTPIALQNHMISNDQNFSLDVIETKHNMVELRGWSLPKYHRNHETTRFVILENTFGQRFFVITTTQCRDDLPKMTGSVDTENSGFYAIWNSQLTVEGAYKIYLGIHSPDFLSIQDTPTCIEVCH